MSGKKRVLAWLGLMAFGFAGSGCKVETKANAAPTPACSQAFLDAISDLGKEFEMTATIYNDEITSTPDKYKQVQRFQTACQQFFGQYRGVTCRARNSTDGKVKTVSATIADPTCTKADEVLAQPTPAN